MISQDFVRALDAFEAVLTAVPADRWESPSPCAEWRAVDVAGHVITGLLAIAARARGGTPDGEPGSRGMAVEDPVAAWHEARAETMAALTPEALRRDVSLPWEDAMTLGEFVARYPLELVVHAWDLARATGRPLEVDSALISGALRTAERFAEHGRDAGLVGPEVVVPGDADDLTRLLAIFGRDPELEGP